MKLRTLASLLLPPILAKVILRTINASPFRGKRVATANPENPQGPAVLKDAWNHLDSTAALDRNPHGIPASERWLSLLERMRIDISSFKTVQEVITFAQTRLDFDHRLPVSECSHLFHLHANTLQNEFPEMKALLSSLSDSPFSRPETMLQVGDKLISNILFFDACYLMQCLSWVKHPELVCEIGGGYGLPAWFWITNRVHNPKTYIIVDFPESLFFSETFLRSSCQGFKTLYITNDSLLDVAFIKEHRIVFCPIHHVGALGSLTLDLVVNTGSMQEMSEPWIDFWMAWLDRQSCRYFYSANYFAQPLQALFEAGNTWSPRLSPKWTVRLQRTNPATMMQQTTRPFAEILAEKTGSASSDKSALVERYKQMRERVLQSQTLLECMDIVRQEPGDDVVWDLLNRIMALQTIPKEAFYLAEMLNRNASAEFREKHGTALEEISQRLREIRAAGFENIHSI